MKDKIEKLKQELREFIELSKTITEREWEPSQETVWSGGVRVCAYTEEVDATFIARSRNISPAMAECLLITISKLEFYNDNGCPGMALLEEILTIWEAAK
jgi:hypothetical protein